LGQQLSWIVGHWRPYRRRIPALLLLTVANAAVLAAYPYFIKRIIDGLTAGFSPRLLLVDIGVLAAVGVAHFLVYASLQILRVRLNLGFEFGVRLRAFEHVLRLGESFRSRFRTGDLVTRLMDDVSDKLCWFMCSGIFRVFEALAIIVFGMAMMFAISPRLTLYTAGPLPVLVGLFVFTAGRLHQRYAAVQLSISQLNDALESCFSGIRVIKAFAAEESQRRLVLEAIEKQRQAEVRAVRWQTVIDSLYGNIWQLAIVGVLLAGGGMAIAGRVTLGDIVAFDAYVLLLVGPMFDIGQFLVRGKLSGVAIGRITELERFPPDVVEPDERPPLARRPTDPVPPDDALLAPEQQEFPVEFQQLRYRYSGAASAALDGLSFRAAPGELSALVGEIGSGKSTALALVPRILEATAGQVLIQGRDARDWNPIALRQAIGYVPQEPYLLSGTVLDNIRFGRSWVTDDDVEMALDVSQLHRALERWPGGLQTQVGSRGVKLSGGQKQRVALARALAGRPAILLLDDCTSSLDAETEEHVWGALLAAIPACTTILVTHRPATLERADQIIVLGRGRAEEIGTFAELNHSRSHFHRLYVQWRLREDAEGSGEP
jgi:ATP-binding cassette subfamily B protein